MLAPLIAMVLLASPGTQEAVPTAAEVMQTLSSLELAAGDVYRIRDLTLRRDVVALSFQRGVLAFLEPVNGKVTGAVFVGSGDVLAIPPDEVERRQVARFTGSPILTERFDTAILRFTDDTYLEVVESILERPQEDVRADDLEALLPWGANLGETSRLLNFRIMQDLVGSPDRPIFFAAMRGERLGWFDIAYDERRAEEVVIGDSVGPSGETQVQNIWASFNRRSESRDPRLYGIDSHSDIDVSRYQIDTHISEGAELSATAIVDFTAMRDNARALSFELARSLRVLEVRLGGNPIPFFQHDLAADDLGSSLMDKILVVLPQPTVEGEQLQLEFDYSGRVLERRGNGVYYVSERVAWYPHVGRLDPTFYELRFHYPPQNVLVATGQQIEESVSGGLRHSVWESASEFVVAGFNYGDFAVESDEAGSVPIYVHVNNDIETVYQDLAIRRAVLTERVLSELQGAWRRRNGIRSRVPVPMDFELFSTRRLASNIVAEVRFMLDFYSGILGDYPFERLSVSQFPVAFSQGWPTLLYVSTLSFFDEEQRAQLEIESDSEWLDLEYVLAHEVAHQWFGNKVSWPSYRDQWIGEGFSNYLAIMYLEEAEGSRRGADAVLARLRSRLLADSGSGRIHADNGPVWIGQRLTSVAVPDGYVETVYPKSTWIVHMLRMLMRDGANASDDRFVAMLRDYLDEFDGRSATTWDLKDVAERHMTARMDVEGDGTLDWFFSQWVLGTGVPEYVLEYDVVGRSGGGVAVRGQIEDRQRLGFTMPLPVYVRTATGEVRYIRDVLATGDQTAFTFDLSFVPDEVLLDPYGTVLGQ